MDSKVKQDKNGIRVGEDDPCYQHKWESDSSQELFSANAASEY